MGLSLRGDGAGGAREAAFAELGVPLPQMLSREHLEESFPFIGPGGIRAGGSIGMLMGAGEPGSTEPAGILLFPVNKEAALLKGFTSLGGRVLPEASDTVKLKGTYFRRTEGFLLTGPKGEYIVDAAPLALEEGLTGAGMLAEVSVDLDAGARTIPPPSIRSSRTSRPHRTGGPAMSTRLGGAWGCASTSGC